MATSVEIVIPVLNEERALPSSVKVLHSFLSERLSTYDWRIVIADNGSNDSTPQVSAHLIENYQRVRYTRLEKRGRGRALSKTWMESEADIVAYMDVDLSTNLNAFPKLVNSIDREGYDIAIGSRLIRGSTVIGRPPHREFISRIYSLIFRSMFFTGFHDAQCGFKAITRQAAQLLLPLIQDTGWFFDSELLILSEKNKYRIVEIPVTWADDPDSRVRIISTAYGDLKGLLRLRFGGLRRASRILSERGHCN